MNILAFDTASQSCSVALTADRRLIAETTSFEKGTHAKRLLPMIDALLKREALKMADIGGFAATIGPGSFTGLRIGISTLKGFAAATGKPVAGISTLEALAHQCTLNIELICPLLDARKKEVYYRFYSRTANGLKALSEERNAMPLEAVGQIDTACAFLGNGAELYRDIISEALGQNAVFGPRSEDAVRAGTVAMLAHKRFVNDDADDPFTMAPLYIRGSDAESASK